MRLTRLLPSILALALLAPGLCHAQTSKPISLQPSATLPLSGSELILLEQIVNGKWATRQTPASSLVIGGVVTGAITASMLAPGAAASNMGMVTAAPMDMSGATDVSASLQALINAYPTKRIYVPAGTPRLNNSFTLNNGQTLQCEGRTQTTFIVDGAFSNMSANGVISLGTGEPGASVFDCGVSFTQPSTLTRGTIIQYPPAFYAVGMPRFQLDRVRVSGAWRCLNASGNVGGAYIGRMECGAYANDATGAIAFDGSQDFIHIDSIEFWPYGMNASGVSVYSDQTTVGMSIGRVDGFSANHLGFFTSAISFTANAGISGVPYSIADLQLDADGSVLTQAGALLQIGNFYSTKDTVASGSGSVMSISGGQTVITNANVQSSAIYGSAISVTGGLLAINGGVLNHQAVAQPFLLVSGGSASINNAMLKANPSTARSQPFLQQSGSGSLSVQGVQAVAPMAETSPVVYIGSDNSSNFIANNNFSGWSTGFPTGVVTGVYELMPANSGTVATTTASQTFTGVNTFAGGLLATSIGSSGTPVANGYFTSLGSTTAPVSYATFSNIYGPSGFGLSIVAASGQSLSIGGNGAASWSFDASKNFLPTADNVSSLGSNTIRISNAYITTAKITPVAIASLPTCNSTNVGDQGFVNNGVTAPTYHLAVSSTGTGQWPVWCTYNGSTYSWVY